MRNIIARLLAAMLSIILCLGIFAGCNGGGKDESARLNLYINSLKTYVSDYMTEGTSAQKLAALTFVSEMDNFSYDTSKSYEQNQAAVDEKFGVAVQGIAKGFSPKYDEAKKIEDYLYTSTGQDDPYAALEGYLKFNDLGGALLGPYASLLGAGRASYSAGAVVSESIKDYTGKAIYTAAEMQKIMSLEDEALKTEMLAVRSVNAIIRSSVVSFLPDDRVVLTNHYTDLGCRYFKAAYNIDYVVDQEYYAFGTYVLSKTPVAGTNDYDITATFEQGTLKFVINAVKGDVFACGYIFERYPYAVVDEAPNATGGFDGDISLFETDDYVFSKGVTAMKDVKYGNRTMKALAPEQAADSGEQYDKEQADPTILVKRQMLDLYIPAPEVIEANKAKGNGVILLIHGGSWTSGEKEAMTAAARDWANRGYFAVAINHTYGGRRYADNDEYVSFLSIQNEINMAMQKVKEISDEKGWNINKCATNGYSSGSHLAAWYAYDMGNEEDAPIPVVCTFSMVGPMSFYLDCWVDGVAMPLGPQVAIIALNDPKLFDIPDAEQQAIVEGIMAGTHTRDQLDEYKCTSYSKEEYQAKIDSISPLSFVKKGDCVPTVLAEACLDTMLISGEHGLQMMEAFANTDVEHKIIMFPNTEHLGAGNAECGNIYRRYYYEMVKKYFGY